MRRKKKREERREKLRVLGRQNYQARGVLLYMELLADNNAFRAPIAGDL